MPDENPLKEIVDPDLIEQWPPKPAIGPRNDIRTAPRNRFWLFDDSPLNSKKAIWAWWELRRLVYNGVLFVVGVCSILLCVCVGSMTVPTGEDFVEPMAIFLGVPVFAILANICYTAGPIYDSSHFIGKPRVNQFKLGFGFSIILTAFPGGCAILAWIETLVTGHKL